MTSARRIILGAIAAASTCLGLASEAGAATPTRLVLSQSAAFSMLGHSCGGIQEEVFATGFASNGYPAGDVYMSTKCGGSGRGGGYKTTTYSGWASVTWTWFAETGSFAPLEGPAGGGGEFVDAHGDRLYNVGASAYLETGEPPLQPPAAPSGVSASVSIFESGETEYLRMQVGWTLAAETAGLISSSTVTATPVKPGPPVLSTTVSGTWASAYLGPVQPSTTYQVTVTNTDSEGTSQPGSTEVTSPGEGGGGGGTPGAETCEQSQGTIKLSPGLSETPRVQNITVKGELKGCDGPQEFTEAKYVAHLTTTEEVTCSALASASLEPTTKSDSLVFKATPNEAGGNATGSLIMPLSEVSAYSGLSGTLEGGPFQTPASINAGTIGESFTGGPTCGQAVGKKAAKPVKKGTFSTSAVEIG